MDETDLLARIDAFEPSADGSWRDLDTLLAALWSSGEPRLAWLPTLLRVFERFPRHDGHGVFWSILHGIERIAGYEPVLVEYVTRTPTEMGITMLQRIANAGIGAVGAVDLDTLIAELAPRAPVIDYTIAPITARAPTATRRPLDVLLAELAAYHPAPHEIADWNSLLALVAELLDHGDTAVVTPLLQTLDRFHSYAGFAPFWPIVNGLEQLPRFAGALVESVQQTPTRYGTTLLLRLLAREVYFVDGVDVAQLAAACLARQA